jgi:hypothetical protein
MLYSNCFSETYSKEVNETVTLFIGEKKKILYNFRITDISLSDICNTPSVLSSLSNGLPLNANAAGGLILPIDFNLSYRTKMQKGESMYVT